MKKTAAWLVRHALEQVGVRYTFGIPGVHNIEVYDELGQSKSIEPILVTHEMCAAFMADAISRTTDSIGTIVIVPAAGVTHAASGIGEAFLDGIPMLVIAGGIRTDLDKRFQLHDVDQRAIVAPLARSVLKVDDYDDIVPMVFDAFEAATASEPGPAFIELPANLQMFKGDVRSVPNYQPVRERPELDEIALDHAAELLATAERPALFVGWGSRNASAAVEAVAELLAAPVATTLQGLAAFPGDHPLHVGMGFGPSAVPAALNAFSGCDALLAIGTRFAEIATGSYGVKVPEALVHIDINSDVIGANYPAAVALPGDATVLVPALLERLRAKVGKPPDVATLAESIAEDKAEYLNEWLAHDSGDRVNPGVFFRALRAALDDEAVVVADDGNHTFLTAELMPIHRGGMYLSPSDFNCMGYCVPATIATRLAHPALHVVGICGDGAFLMSGTELATAAARDLGCVIFVFNDGELSQIAQAQELPYNRKTCTVLPGINFRAFAEAVGAHYVAMPDNASVEQGIEEALRVAAENRPVLVDVRVDYSRRTRFTDGTVRTNLERFDARNRLRFIGRALWRKITG
ncbi:MAG: thiamine pyrophosphate-binding protein [Pseudomonadota bacterium]